MFTLSLYSPCKAVKILRDSKNQRWSPRGHILKSLALASRPQVLENWPVLGSRTAVFFGMLKFCGALVKFFGKRFLVEIAWKIFVKTFFFFFFGEHLPFVSLVLGLEHSCPWPRECLSSERLSLALASDFFYVLGLGLEPCVLDSTSGKNVLKFTNNQIQILHKDTVNEYLTHFYFHHIGLEWKITTRLQYSRL